MGEIVRPVDGVFETVVEETETVLEIPEAVGRMTEIGGEPFVAPFPTYEVVLVIVDGDSVEASFRGLVVTEGCAVGDCMEPKVITHIEYFSCALVNINVKMMHQYNIKV